MTTPPLIALDGPSASGKGTLARRLASHFDFAYLDTGMLSRAVALAVLQDKNDPSDPVVAERAALALEPADIQDAASNPVLRSEACSIAASKVAVVPAVRAALLKFQQNFGQNPPFGKKGAVLDGRDIGTIVAPHAPVKIYVTASDEIRAERRFKELQERHETVTYGSVLADMKERDARDAERSAAPAKPASDAVILDTTRMNADQAFDEAVRIATDKLSRL